VGVNLDSPFSGRCYNRYAEPSHVRIDSIEGPPTYQLPPGLVPRQFLKTALTEPEMIRAIESSKLNHILDDPKPQAKMRPPLSLGNGHLGLLLSAGELNGLVEKPGCEPHVIRGSVRKEKYERECDVTESESGSLTEKKVISERVVRVVRTLDRRGNFKTLEG
jgi:hypothetical protein